MENLVAIQGSVIESDALRYTPAGVPMLKFKLAHRSQQTEAGGNREVGCEIEAVAFDAQARLLASAQLGVAVKIKGFLDRKTKTGRALLLHANEIEFVVTDKV
ncbi:MAG: primosomal replication protein N [Burkholderiales bacterium]